MTKQSFSEKIKGPPRKLKLADKIAMCFSGTIILLTIIASIYLGAHTKPSETVDEDKASIMAITICEQHVREVLRSPKSADFPWLKKASFDGKLAILRSYVDAQNGFGAMVRTHFVCTVRHIDGNPDKLESWKLEEFFTTE